MAYQTTISVESPNKQPVTADGTSIFNCSVILKNINGSSVGEGIAVTLTSSGSAKINGVASPVTVNTNFSGIAIFTITDEKAESVTLSQDKDSHTTTATFVPGIAATMTVVPSSTTPIAGSLPSPTITVTVVDAKGNKVADNTQVSHSSPNLMSSSISGSNNEKTVSGVVTYTITDMHAEKVTYNFTCGAATGSQELTFNPGNAANVNFIANSGTQTLVAGQPATITLVFTDSNGNYVADATPVSSVKMSGTPGNITFTAPAPEQISNNGRIVYTLLDTKAEAVQYKFTCGGIDALANITYTPGSVAAITGGTIGSEFTNAAPIAGQTSSITLTVKDANGNNVADNTIISVAGAKSSTFTPAVPKTLNGQVTFAITDNKAETVNYVFTSNGITYNAPALTFTNGPVSPTLSTVEASNKYVKSDGTAQSVITVTVLDANSNPVPNQSITLLGLKGDPANNAANTGNSFASFVYAGANSDRGMTAPNGNISNVSGVVTFNVTDTENEVVLYRAEDTTSPGYLLSSSHAVVAYTSVATSSFSATSTSVVADGSTKSTIKVTLLDSSSPAKGVQNKVVTLSANGGNSIINGGSSASVTTLADGTASFDVTDVTAETVTYTAVIATDNNCPVTGNQVITFIPGAVSVGNSSVLITKVNGSAVSPAASANSTSSVDITVTLKDAQNNLITGKSVKLSDGNGHDQTATTALGVATFTINKPAPGQFTYTATDVTDSPNVVISQKPVVTFYSGSSVQSISPASGPIAGGQQIEITGINFAGASSVTIGGQAISSLSVNPAGTKITGLTPAHAVGSSAVVVTTPGGVSTDVVNYIFVAVPTFASLDVQNGKSIGGDVINITGAHFKDAGVTKVNVLIGNTFAAAVKVADASVTVQLDTAIKVTMPAGTNATTPTVFVQTDGGYCACGGYSYWDAPTVTALNKVAGPIAGGQTITLAGTNFVGVTGASAVKIGSVNVTSYTVNSQYQIVAVLPAGSAGSANIQVTGYGGTSAASNDNSYKYYNLPIVTGLSQGVLNGPLVGGASIQIDGTNLLGATQVAFGAAVVQSQNFTTIAIDKIVLNVPAGSAGAQIVTVTTPGGVSVATTVKYTYFAVPLVTGISQTSAQFTGLQAGSPAVHVTGSNLVGATAVILSMVYNSQTYSKTTSVNGTDVNVDVNGDVVILATSFPKIQDPNDHTILYFGFPNPLPDALKDNISVYVNVVTPGGTSNSSVQFTYTNSPIISSLSPASGAVSGGNTLTINGLNLSGATLTIGGNAVTCTVVSTNQITATVPAALASGPQLVVVTVSGNSSNSLSYMYYAPLINNLVRNLTDSPLVSLMDGPLVGGTDLYIIGQYFTGVTSVTLGGTTLTKGAQWFDQSDTAIKVTLPASGTAGAKAFVVSYNSISSSSNFTYTYHAPSIGSLSSSSGSVFGTNQITINGQYLTGFSSVKIGSTTASVVGTSTDISIKVTVPVASAVGAQGVQVTSQGVPSNIVNYTYVGPVITGMSSTSGVLAGGNAVNITGTGLLNVRSVNFGSNNVLMVDGSDNAVISDTSISVHVPAGSDGSVDVYANINSFSSNHLQYRYYAVPTVQPLLSLSGSSNGNAPFSIQGAHLSSVSSVKIGGAVAPIQSGGSDSQINVKTPSSTTLLQDLPIVVTTIGGSVNAGTYKYYALPVISTLTPADGSTAGGNKLTITGLRFTGETSVTIDGKLATVSSVSDSQIVINAIPAGTNANAPVVVITPGGASVSKPYRYHDIPVITAGQVFNGPNSGSQSITINGQYLTGATSVTFGKNLTRAITVTSDSSISVVVPSASNLGAISTVDITIATPSGGSKTTAKYNYTIPVAAVGKSTLIINKSVPNAVTGIVTATLNVTLLDANSLPFVNRVINPIISGGNATYVGASNKDKKTGADGKLTITMTYKSIDPKTKKVINNPGFTVQDVASKIILKA